MATITFQGNPLNTSGDLPGIGTTAPDLSLVNSRLQDVSLASYAGKRKVLSIVPSLDTPTCAASTRIFNQKADSIENTVRYSASCIFCLPFSNHVIRLSRVEIPVRTNYYFTSQEVLLLA